MLAYLDTSALVKLVLVEPESAALTAQIANADRSPPHSRERSCTAQSGGRA